MQEIDSQRGEFITRIDWRDFFRERRKALQDDVVFAEGGTLDSVYDADGKLGPTSHPVSIETTRSLPAIQIMQQFHTHIQRSTTLGELYKWTIKQPNAQPWSGLNAQLIARISSFDSGQKGTEHFVAAAGFYGDFIENPNVHALLSSGGTDTLIPQAALNSILFLKKLLLLGKKHVSVGSPESGYNPNSLAPYNVLGGLFTILDQEVPPGIHTVSSERLNGSIVVHILPAFGSVKLHADGYFQSPNSGPILSITDTGEIYKYPAYYKLIERLKYVQLLPDLYSLYFSSPEMVERLERAMKKRSIVTVENDPEELDSAYAIGKRAFVVEARGAGNASPDWKERLEELIGRHDTTVVVITSARKGDVDVKKYAAGLDIEEILSGRTLQRDAAMMITPILHDLRQYEHLTLEESQRLIELYCYIMGMIDLPSETLQEIHL